MKILKLSVFLFAVALFGSAAAFAGDNNKISLNLYENVSVEGRTLKPGHYTVSWEGSGPTVQVTISQGKQAVANFSAHVAEQAIANPANAYGSSVEADGSHSLTSIYVGGKRTSLELEQKEARQQTSTPAAK
jgi:hypothetical protein